MNDITAEIITTGYEVLTGRTVDTNALYLSKRLAQIGITPSYRTTVGDDQARYREVLEAALSRADVVVVTGGLGPTDDDLTRETCARVLGRKLIIDDDAQRHVREILTRYGIRCEESELRQALIPEGATIIPNTNGTAYGFLATVKGKHVAALSGVPSEMEQMSEEHLFPLLKGIYTELRPKSSRLLRFFGVSESGLQAEVRPAIKKFKSVAWGITASQMVLTVSLSAGLEEEHCLEEIISEIENRLGEKMFSSEGATLQECVARMLKDKNLSIALAESCTGGLATHLLSQVPGISENLLEGAVTYSNDSKVRRLGVSRETLEKHGAVSVEVASQMSNGIRKESGADVGVGITGIAGPAGGTNEKPVGLVYISVCAGGEPWTREFKFNGTRNDIQRRAANCALNMVRLTMLRESKD